MDGIVAQGAAILLGSLRFAPTFAFGPPFTLVRIPALIRLFLAVTTAYWASVAAETPTPQFDSVGDFALAALCELLLGLLLATCLQIVMAAVLTIGAVIDVQAGFGLAVLADPTLRSQTPLIGTILSLGGGAVFFGTTAPTDLFAVWVEIMRSVPIGGWRFTPNVLALSAFMSSAFALAIGLAGVMIVTLFLVDLTIGLVSRTLPQMNVLFLGFQIKTLVLLLVAPLALSSASVVLFRLVRLALEASLRLARNG